MPEPLRIVATLHCKPGTGDQAAAAMRLCVAGTRTEAGCLEYAAYRADDAPDRLTVVELWQDQASLDAHNAGPHLRALAGAIKGFLAAPLEVLVLREI